MFSVKIKVPKILFFLAFFIFLFMGQTTHATSTLTYDFTNDDLATTPDFITPVSAGATITVESSATFSSNVAKITDYGSTGLATFSLDDFPNSDYQQVVWENGYTSNLFRQGIYLRASDNGSGLLSGYLFQFNLNLSHGRVFSVTNGTLTTLASPTFTGQGNNTKRYYRATANGSTLTFERSANGSSWTSLASVTDSTYTSGGVYFGEGYGSGTGQSVAGNTYTDNIAYTYDETFDGSVTTPGQPTNFSAVEDTGDVDLTWDLPSSNGGAGITDYKIEYKLSADSTWTTFVDGTSKVRSATVTGLTGGESYDFRVSAINQEGSGTVSSTQTVELSIYGTITITTPVNYQTFQRDDNDLADIAITGTYTGGPAQTIEARFAGGAWTTIDSDVTGGTFSGTLANQSAGQGDLEVRFSSNTAITDSSTYVGIGDIFVVAGQSNASGRGDNNQSYSHATLRATLFGNDDVWKNLTDPHDRNSGQIDAVSSDALAGGSFPPLLATYFLENEGVPVAFIPVAMGGTEIESWVPGGDLYNSMERRVNAVGGNIKAVLWFQGESDSSLAESSGYVDQLNELVDSIATDFNGAKTVIGMLGSATSTGEGRSYVRIAQKEVIETNINAIQGPAMYDVNIDNGCDGTHFCGDEDLAIFAERWWLALDKEFYGGADGFGPLLDEANSFYKTSENAIYLQFTDDSSPVVDTPYVADTDVFYILNGATEKPVLSLSVVNDSIVKLVLTTSINTGQAITVDYAADNRSGILNAVYDSLGLPAMNFKSETISAGSLPNTVSGITPTPTTTSIALSWTAPVAVNPAVTDYEIEYKLSSDVSWTTLADGTGTGTTTTISGLSSNTNYDVRIRAVNLMGNGSYATESNITTSSQTYTISYNSNSATSGSVPGDQTKTESVDLTLQTNSGSLLRTGYTFTGWNTLADGSGTHYNSGGTFTTDANTTLYAEWTLDSDDEIQEDENTGNVLSSGSMMQTAGMSFNNSDNNSNICPSHLILTQNMRVGGRDGRINNYSKTTLLNKEILKEAKILQNHLNRLGFNSGPEDGILGPISDGAIKRMQRFLGTTPDGLVGPITRNAINNSCVN